jgi:hypothetical protein
MWSIFRWNAHYRGLQFEIERSTSLDLWRDLNFDLSELELQDNPDYVLVILPYLRHV